MAKATAICTCSKCGAEFTKVAYKNNRREADSWEKWAVANFTTCPECEEKEYQARMAQVAEDAKSDGLPELTGSPKQINWALDLRKTMLADIDEVMENSRKQLGKEEDPAVNAKNEQIYKEFEITVDYITNQASSKFWIDNRYESASGLLINCRNTAVEEHMASLAGSHTEEAEEEPKTDDSVIVPENATEGTAEVVAEDDRVTAKYPKDDKFRGIVKDAGYGWNSTMNRWIKIISARTGSAVDRAADLTNRLLRAGFSVKCENAVVREKAVSGDFQPECKRWISGFTHGEFEGWLCIEIPKRYADPDSQKLYDAARKINGSKWCRSSDGVAIPMAQHEQAEDFAHIYGYQLTEKARQMVTDYQMQAASKVAKPKKEEHKDVLKEILNSDDTVLADLEDD